MSDSRLKPEPWQQIWELFQSTVERPEELRAAFLELACAGNEDLRRQVESLVAHHAQAGSFLETPPADLAADVLAQEQPRLTEGQFIDHYKALSLLGVGGMGEVYLAEDTRLRRPVALKLLPARFTENRDRVIRFEQEARAASALNHPNIVTIHEIGLIDGKHFIVTEFIEGTTLRQRMTGKSMTLREALDAAIQIASALGAAHAAGIIHRDIKPENIMVRPDGLIKVLDFGLAKLVEDQSPGFEPGSQNIAVKAGTASEARTVLGTLRYMSPEQAMAQPVDMRTDIFSLGVVLYEMVTASLPFRGASAANVLTAILEEEPPPLTEAVPGTPSELEWIERKALAKDRDERYQTVKELQIDLKRLKQELELKQKLDSIAPARRSPESPGNPRKRTGLLRLAALSALTLSALYAGMKLTPSPAPPDFQQLTFRSGNIPRARFDPDGKTVFYSAAFDGGPIQTYRKGVESGAESSKFGPAGAIIQSVSKTQVFMLLDCRLDQGDCHGGTLASLPLNGDNIEPTGLKERVWEAEWSEIAQDFAIITIVDGLFQLEYPRGTVLLSSPDRLSTIRVSPDGKLVAFIDSPKLDDLAGSIKIVDRRGQLKASSRLWTTIKSLSWSPKGDRVLYSAGKTRTLALRSLTLSSHDEEVYRSFGDFKVDDVSSDGQILGHVGDPRSRIAGVTPESRNPYHSWFDWSTAADLSSDGRTLLFQEWGYAVNGVPQLYLKELDGKSEPKGLGPGKALALSPDKKSVLALRTTSPGDSDSLVLISTSTTEDTRVLPRGTIREYYSASWFPDGKQILVSGVEQGELYERSYVQDPVGGPPRPITDEGELAILVSPDCKKLVVRHPNDGKYYLHEYPYRTDGHAPVLIRGLQPDDEPIQWNSDATALYARGPENLIANILLVNLSSGKRTIWKEISPPDPVGNIGVSGRTLITRDGNSYVYTFWTSLARLTLVKGLKF